MGAGLMAPIFSLMHQACITPGYITAKFIPEFLNFSEIPNYFST